MSLAIGGMTCGSCAARLEARLNALEGVDAAVNYATARAFVTVPDPFSPIRLVEEVHAAGFSARVLSGETREQDDLRATEDRRVRSLGRRLVVAGILFMPLGDASIAFWLEPSLRFPGWQWVLVAVALPVVTWCAWPFYSAGLRSLRHGTATMDTLVSLGIVAATAWSVYAMFVRDTSDVHVPISDVFTHQSGGGIYLDVAAGVTTFLLAGRYFEARLAPTGHRGAGLAGRARGEGGLHPRRHGCRGASSNRRSRRRRKVCGAARGDGRGGR